MPLPLPLLLLLLLLLSSAATTTSAATHPDLLHSSCLHASYPTLCLRTLSSYSGPSDTPRDLAQAAVKVSLLRSRNVSAFLSAQLSSLRDKPPTRRALGDCVEQISDSVDQLRRTLAELHHLRGETFRWQMSNAETWVSAALTNEDTCLDGFQEVDGKVKVDVKRKITNVARVTSNALYMINRLEETRG